MATIKDVAKLASVSASTVSRVLSGKVVVDEHTKERVMAAVQSLHYRPNPIAKALRERRTNTIALMVPGIENQIWPLVARGVESIAWRKGYAVVLCNTDNDTEREIAYINRLKQQWIEGIIIAPTKDESPHLHQLVSEGFPVVQVVRGLDHDDIDSVLVDNYQMAYNAVCYLSKDRAQTHCDRQRTAGFEPLPQAAHGL